MIIKKDILILGKGPTQGLEEHSLSAKNMYSINFNKVNTKFCLSLYYTGENSYLFVNGTEIYKFNANAPEIVPNNLCLRNVSKDFSPSKMKKTGFNGHIDDFSVDYDEIDVDDILDIHKYLMRKTDINIKCLGLLKTVFNRISIFFDLSKRKFVELCL